jgi:hypothetical protein
VKLVIEFEPEATYLQVHALAAKLVAERDPLIIQSIITVEK